MKQALQETQVWVMHYVNWALFRALPVAERGYEPREATGGNQCVAEQEQCFV
jgi:hypothetical protein